MNQRAHYQEITSEIEVTVSPTLLTDRTIPERGVYAHSYQVRITNRSEQTVQLLNRHWVVTSANQQVADIKGEGVIGEQPVLQPGAKHEYSSWVVVQDPVGAMWGTYTFVTEEQKFFDVAIPRFDLIYIESAVVH